MGCDGRVTAVNNDGSDLNDSCQPHSVRAAWHLLSLYRSSGGVDSNLLQDTAPPFHFILYPEKDKGKADFIRACKLNATPCHQGALEPP